ncbi:MAG: M48 family metalloprotease [Terriglobales bacterium]
MRHPSACTRALAVVLAVLITVPSWLWAAAPANPQLPDPGSAPMSKQEQEQLGLKAMGEVYKQMPVLPDSDPLVRYIQNLGRRLDQVIPNQYNWPYQFHVVQQKEINAFALPGGPLFINVGTITSADNEAQLAGVIAHEMSHVYMQHSAKQMKQNVGPSIIAGLGQILGSMIGGVGGAAASIGGQLAGGMMSMKYSRADEAQADAVGAIIMYKAGYDPRQMALFFQKLAQEGGSGPQFLSDHPNPGNRVTAVDNEIKNWPPKSLVTDNPGFQQAKQQARSVKAYTAQQIDQMGKSGQIHNTSVPAGVPQSQGPAQPNMGNVSLGQVMPSGGYRDYQGQFSMQYPANWQPMQDQQASGITIAPQAGVAQGAIAYGVVVNGVQAQNAASADDAVNQLLASFQQQMGLRQTSSPRNVSVNGMPAKSVDMSGASPIAGSNGQPLPEHDWVVVIPSNNQTLVYLVFVSPERDWSRLRSTYQHMLSTFRMQ